MGASDVSGIESALTQLANQKIGGLVVPPNAFLNSQRNRIAALAARERIPTIYDNRESVVAGGVNELWHRLNVTSNP